MPITLESWYNYPQYYDLLFREDTQLEAGFVEAACKKYCAQPAKRLLEPGCGTGRLVRELAARGFDITGFDLGGAPLRYLRQCLQRRKLSANLFQGDMADFEVDRPFDAAYCLINTFRHLLTEETAQCHLRAVARAIKPGGIYILGFHILPLDTDEECTERWTAQHGRTKVTGTLRVRATDRRRRIEDLRISLLVRRDGKSDLRLRHDFPLRMYTADEFCRLLDSVPQFEVLDVYDFWYDIDEPLGLDDEITDSVFILRKSL